MAPDSLPKDHHLLLDQVDLTTTALHADADYADGATAVGRRHHSLDQQPCRWLRLSPDPREDWELVMTRESIANMLGVRGEGLT